MKCLILYFSQTNSTRKVAETIGEELSAHDWNVKLKNIKDEKVDNLEEFDLIGFGSPVYYFRLPFIVEDYLKSLPDLNNKAVFSFISYGSYYFDVPFQIRKILKEKNTVNLGFYAARGEDKYLGYLKEGVLLSESHPSKDDISQAKEFTRSLIKSFQQNTVSDNNYNYKIKNKKNLIYNIESLLTKRWLINKIYTRLFFSKKNCTGCGKCVKECPQNNIILNSQKRPKWGSSCELCFNCEMICPVQAIYSAVDMHVFDPVLKYNVRQAVNDNEINYTEIEYKNGEIIKINSL